MINERKNDNDGDSYDNNDPDHLSSYYIATFETIFKVAYNRQVE